MHNAFARRLAFLIACTACGISVTPAPAASAVLWVNGLSGEFKRADLSLDQKTLFRQVPQGTICPWFPLPAAKASFEVTGSAGLNLTGDWEFPDNSRVLFVTYGKEKAASRTLLLPSEPKPGFQVFNALPTAIIQTGENDGPAARAGFSLPIAPDGTARLSFADGAAWSIRMTPPAPDALQSSIFLVLHQAKCEGEHDVMIGVVDSVSGKSDEWMLVAGTGRDRRESSQGGFRAAFFPAPIQPQPPFDAASIDWSKVKSQIAWFNATPHNQSLAIGGMMVFRQLRAGSLAHFAPWPQGRYDCESHTNPGDRIGKASFTLDEDKRVVLVSIGRVNQDPRLFAIEAAAAAGSNRKPANTIRIMNGLPVGELVLPTRFEGARIESGGISKAVGMDPATPFSERVLLALAEGRDRSLQPKSPDFSAQPGDWVLIIFLNASDPDALDYAWVNFTTGTLLAREDFSAKKQEE
jgi:hypothetical protein